MSALRLTYKQRGTLLRAYAATLRGRWYRASGSGERVTLASLHGYGVLVRRTRRAGKSSADNAYEYQVEASLKPVLAQMAAEAKAERGVVATASESEARR